MLELCFFLFVTGWGALDLVTSPRIEFLTLIPCIVKETSTDNSSSHLQLRHRLRLHHKTKTTASEKFQDVSRLHEARTKQATLCTNKTIVNRDRPQPD